MGAEIMMEEVVELVETTILGRAWERHFNIKTLREWVESSWRYSYDPLPSICRLARSWFLLNFKEAS